MSKRKLDAGESGHLQVEVERLKADLEMARRGLEMKNNEVSIALTSFGELQRSNDTREAELKIRVKDSEEKTLDLQEELSSLAEQHSATKQELMSVFSDLNHMADQLATAKKNLAEGGGGGSKAPVSGSWLGSILLRLPITPYYFLLLLAFPARVQAL